MCVAGSVGGCVDGWPLRGEGVKGLGAIDQSMKKEPQLCWSSTFSHFRREIVIKICCFYLCEKKKTGLYT